MKLAIKAGNMQKNILAAKHFVKNMRGFYFKNNYLGNSFEASIPLFEKTPKSKIDSGILN